MTSFPLQQHTAAKMFAVRIQPCQGFPYGRLPRALTGLDSHRLRTFHYAVCRWALRLAGRPLSKPHTFNTFAFSGPTAGERKWKRCHGTLHAGVRPYASHGCVTRWSRRARHAPHREQAGRSPAPAVPRPVVLLDDFKLELDHLAADHERQVILPERPKRPRVIDGELEPEQAPQPQ